MKGCFEMITKVAITKNFKFTDINFTKVKMTVGSDQRMLLVSDIKNNHFKIAFEIEQDLQDWETHNGHLTNAHLKMVVTAEYEIIDLVKDDTDCYDVTIQLVDYTINYCHFSAYHYKEWDEQIEKQVLIHQLKQQPEKMDYLTNLTVQLKSINEKK